MSIAIRTGDCIALMREMPAQSVHCCITSPPYYGLRDYGTAAWEGGDAACDHMRAGVPVNDDDPGIRMSTLGGGKKTTTAQAGAASFRETCGKCGARRVDQQIGLEDTPADYVARLVEVFREVRRVLRDDATLWVNLGDSIVNKQLQGIPWRVAFALQADGWWLRQDIIWAKPNPMPESVTDRCTKAHEYLFLLSKRATYYYDQDAIRETPSGRTDPMGIVNTGANREKRSHTLDGSVGANRRSVWTVATQPYSGAHFATFPADLIEPCIKAGTSERGCCPGCGAPWARVVERTAMVLARSERTHELGRTRSSGTMLEPPRSETLGWEQTCACPPAAPVPATVLDCFGGAGTTALVADRLGRNAILCELNPAYADMARDRLQDDAGLFYEAAE